jgi:polar amino acid transport system substrate-binding protein
MKNFYQAIRALFGRSGALPLVLAITASTLLASCDGITTAPKQASVYDRVMKTGVIRAAYISYPPALMKDTKTGKMSGIFVDVLEKAAANLGLKVQWTEEVGWGSQIEGLAADRYDIIGSPVWANPTRGKLTTLSRPVYYSGIGIYVRADDTRFAPAADGSWSSLNNANVKIATIDGETGDLIARTQFPTAQRDSLPQNADISQLFLEVAGGKADAFFAEPYFALEYYKHNPHNIKNIAEQHPIKTLGNVYMMKANEPQLKQMIDVAIEDLINSGYVDEELHKYEGGSTFYRSALEYQPKE